MDACKLLCSTQAVVGVNLAAGATGPWGGASMTEADWLACEDPFKMLQSPHVGKESKESQEMRHLVNMPALDAMGFWNVASEWRKVRLFACACVRQVWPMLRHEWSRRVVEAAEQYVEGSLTPEEASRAYDEMQEGFRVINKSGAIQANQEPGIQATLAAAGAAAPLHPHYLAADKAGRRYCPALEVSQVVGYVSQAEMMEVYRTAGKLDMAPAARMRAHLAELLRDVVGNPFRPARLDPALRTPGVASLAQAAYEERALPSGHLDLTRLVTLADALESAGCPDADILAHLRSPGPHVRGCWALDLILGRE
jgi:hypothetical protein